MPDFPCERTATAEKQKETQAAQEKCCVGEIFQQQQQPPNSISMQGSTRKPEPEPEPEPSSSSSSFGQQAERSAATHLKPEVVQLEQGALLRVGREDEFSGQHGEPKAMAPLRRVWAHVATCHAADSRVLPPVAAAAALAA